MGGGAIAAGGGEEELGDGRGGLVKGGRAGGLLLAGPGVGGVGEVAGRVLRDDRVDVGEHGTDVGVHGGRTGCVYLSIWRVCGTGVYMGEWLAAGVCEVGVKW